MKIAVVDDNPKDGSRIKQYIERYALEQDQKFQVFLYASGLDFLDDMERNFDVVFMDIEMLHLDGIETARKMRERDDTTILIFITNLAQYAIHGYEVGALDYILKPVSYFTFSQKFGRAVAKLKKRSSRKQVTVPVKGGVMRMELSEIHYIESEGHNLVYHTKDGDHISSGTMKAVETAMEGMDFSRINKCYLVNLEHVDGVRDKYAIVHNDRLLISRPRMKQFMQELTRYWGERS